MVVKERLNLSFQEFVKQGLVRLKDTTTLPTDVRITDTADGIEITNVEDLLDGDHVFFHAQTQRQPTLTSSGRSLRSEAVRLILTFVLFVCLHQSFLWWVKDSNSRTEMERVRLLQQNMKYPSISRDL
jgi:hypothetical protein